MSKARTILAATALLSTVLAASAGGVRAEPDPEANNSATTLTPPPVTTPAAPRVLHVPTAWLQPPATVYASTGVNHRGGGFLSLSTGLGRLAEADLNISDRFISCAADCAGDTRDSGPAWLATALFKIGMAADELFSGQPALAIGFRRSFYTSTSSSSDKPEVAELYLAASRKIGGVGVHAGAQLFDAESDDSRLLDISSPVEQVRPFLGIEWVPAIYPRTTVLLDFSWVPEFRQADATTAVDLTWLAGWGIRYQALSWGSIELAIRHRENEGLADSTVLVRVNGTTSFKPRND